MHECIHNCLFDIRESTLSLTFAIAKCSSLTRE